ncbi:choice-of-anchor L domain-containing protein [Winogradskyella maritima]|uniref:Choice-of-anchor L domain-containing protein n=1 Tax=Winogradskyella maritima TaxID=1517766 RepID=A0ABV8ACV7_9FLAO|nr:choice-of-anchor L domain-containing protein [Winogradskyella maritima]
MKRLLFIVFLFLSGLSFAQDLLMQNGNFIRCAPDRFFDSGGPTGSYGNNENFTITICPDASGDFVQLDFSQFSTQQDLDVMRIYNGNSTNAALIGEYSGTNSPGIVLATGQTGCLTITFTSDNIGSTIGWDAAIRCVEDCQTITASIDSSNPMAGNSGAIEIIPGQTIDFTGSGTFSDDASNATYTWDFGNGATATGTSVSNQFNFVGGYNVTLTVSDDNPLGCSVTATIPVVVNGSIVTINNAAFPQSSLGPEDLIRDVLVTGGCSEVDNFEISVAGNPNDLTTKSYGYFTKGGSVDFPFDEGIVLSTGRASDGGNVLAPGLQSTNNGLGTDADLETALGITNTQDATSIKFNFTPTIDQISFRYLMASEEYDGNTECQFADSFAFLLREVGQATYQNLAVLPDGTPISVTNINNSNACGANQEFFAGYNLGETNFGGRTEVLTATANVTPNVTYEIKLVVSDQGAGDDRVWDSAIFIEAGSFNLGGELGEDRTIANGTAECSGDPLILDTQASGAQHIWYKDDIEITGETESTLLVTEPGTYRVNVIFDVNCDVEDSVLVEFRVAPVIEGTASDISTCSGSATAPFDLTFNDSIILGTQDPALFNITYHNSLDDAQMDNSPIANPDTYTGSDAEVIFFRIEAADSGICFETGSFTLNLFSTVTADDATFELCDDDTDGDDTNGFVTFDLSQIDVLVIGAQDPAQFSVSYHANITDADMRMNPLPNGYINSTSGTEQIIARVENDFNTDCYETSTVTLVVNPLPVITDMVELLQCDDDNDGFSDFNLTESEELISSMPSDLTFTYYTSQADAEMGNAAIMDPTVYTNTDPSSNPDVLFVRAEDANGCYRIAQLDLIVSTTQIPDNFELTYNACDDGSVDNDIRNGVSTFDFSDATAQIVALYPAGQNVTVTYFETIEDALAEQNQIPDISNHRNDASPFLQNIVVRVDSDTDNSCLGLGEHIVLRTVNPQPNTDPDDLILCDDITVDDLQEEFDLTVNETYIFNGQPDLVATYFTSEANAISNMASIPDPTAYQNTTTPETIFVRVEDTNTNCFAVVDFDISVNPLPDTVAVTDLMECENNTDGVFEFDLESKTNEILNGQDPTIFTVTYHETQAEADDLMNPLSSPFTNTINPQPIYVAITNTVTNCSTSAITFNVEVMEGASFSPDGDAIVYELCDNVNDNDGFGQFDFTTQLPEILDTQDPADYTVTFHTSFDNADMNMEPLPTLYENLTNPQIIFVRVSNNISPDICYEVGEMTLQVNLYPEFELQEQYVLCTSINGTEVVDVPPVIDTGLSDTMHDFEWRLDGTVIPGETGPSLTPTQGGMYEVAATDVTTSAQTFCSTTQSTIVIESEPPVVTVQVNSQAFEGNHSITATATGTSTYEFSLDNGPWQSSGDFENVTGGAHTVYARDVLGCGVSSTDVLLIDYKPYFTPNGDGNHDLWNIAGINTQPTAKIYIFDRFGKLLKQLSPLSAGWDGTFGGQPMPTSDYWFLVEYTEPLSGERKEFKAHFTLKR